MRYYKQCDDDGHLLFIGTGVGGEEITESEYNDLLEEIREKAQLVSSLYSGAITIEDVPAEWREEILRRVDKMIAEQGAAENQDIPAEEALDILLGVKE